MYNGSLEAVSTMYILQKALRSRLYDVYFAKSTDTRRRGRRRLVRRRGSPVARGRNADSGSVVWIASPTRPRADPVCAWGVQFGRAPEGSLAPKSFPSRCFPVVRRRLGRFLRSVPRRRSALLPGVRRHQLAAAAAHLDSVLGASVPLVRRWVPSPPPRT